MYKGKVIGPHTCYNTDLKQKYLTRDQALHKWRSYDNHVDKMTFKDFKSEWQCLWRAAKLNSTEEVLNNTEKGNLDKDILELHKIPIKGLLLWCCTSHEDNGTLISDAKGKSEVLNKQYTFVFTDKDTSNITDFSPSPNPCMLNIKITNESVDKTTQEPKFIHSIWP